MTGGGYSRQSGLIARFRAVLRLALAVVLSLALVWLVSTEDQRRGYLKMLGLWEAAQALGGKNLRIAAFGSEFEIAHFLPRPIAAPPPSALTTDGTRYAQDGIGHPCRTSGPANPTHKTQQEVYRWTGADGRPAFSDQPPRGADAQVVGLTAEGGVGMFSSDYRFVGGAGDSAFASALPANIDGVFRFLAKGLALHGVQPLHVRLTVIDGERRFVDYLNSKPHKLIATSTSGFYSFDGNEAVARWMGPAVTLAVTRHEITHLALGNWLGDTPCGSTRAWPNSSSGSSSNSPMPPPPRRSRTWTTSPGCTAPAPSRPCAPSWRWIGTTGTASATTSPTPTPGHWCTFS